MIKYVVYTSQGFTMDNNGNETENLQILEMIDKDTCKEHGIVDLYDAIMYAKNRMVAGEYGGFTTLSVLPIKEE